MVCVGVIWTETWGEHDPLKVHLQAQGTDDVWIRSLPAARASERGCCLLRGKGRRRRFSAWTADPGGTCSQAPRRRLKPQTSISP